MYTFNAFRAELLELMHLERYSSYGSDEIEHLNTLSQKIRSQLPNGDFEHRIDPTIWECLSGFEAGVIDRSYRGAVLNQSSRALERLVKEIDELQN